MEQGNKPYVFISYSHLDTDTVLPLIKGLQQRGIRLWYDDGIEAATEWEEYIGERVVHCSSMIVFLSQNTVESENCRDELSLARRHKKKVLVVYLKSEKKIKLSYYWELAITSKQSMFMDRISNREKFLDKLVSARVLQPCRIPVVTPAEDPAPAQETPAAEVPAQETAKPVAKEDAAPVDSMVEIVEPVRKNEPEGMLQLGISYDEQAHSTDDWEQAQQLQKQAAECYRTSAEAGNKDAMYRFALCCYRGRGVQTDYREAFDWAVESCALGNADAAYLCATFHEKGIGTKPDDSMAKNAFQVAAELGHVDACLRLADCYMNGKGTDRDPDRALSWYTEAGQRGSAEGMLRAADLYAKEGMALDAFTWYQRAAGKNQMARFKVAMCHLEGYGTPVDKSCGFMILMGLADYATPDIMPSACYRLAQFFEGEGEMRGAARYYHRAAALGCKEAYAYLERTPGFRKGLLGGLRFAVTRSRYGAENANYKTILLPWEK